MKSFYIEKMTRIPGDGINDELNFTRGVNLIIGQKDAGKTQWLRMLDYTFGDEGQPEEALGIDISEKYEAISLTLSIENEKHLIERKWKVKGMRGKVFVDGLPMLSGDFSKWLLEKLEIPVLHFPKGSPFLERAWPQLSWRMMFRQIYRQERYWADIADNQPDVEQHACLLQFAGVADRIYSEDYAKLVEKKKEFAMAVAGQKAHQEILDEVSKDLLAMKELSVSITAESLSSAIENTNQRILEIQNKRKKTLAAIREKVISSMGEGKEDLSALQEKLSVLVDDKNKLLSEVRTLASKKNELEQYLNSINAEFERLERARSGGAVLSAIKVTHCPVCDSSIDSKTQSPNICYLCHRPHKGQNDKSDSSGRLEFEIGQLTEEKKEAAEVINAHEKLLRKENGNLVIVNEQISIFEEKLLAAKSMAVAFLPPELAIFDGEIGMFEEQLRQIKRVEAIFGKRRDISDRLPEIEEEINRLEIRLKEKSVDLNFEKFSAAIQDGINSYLNRLNEGDKSRWTHEPVRFEINEKSFKLTLKNKNWSTQIGATSRAYVLLGFHYALLSLLKNENYKYPGLVIIDFPVTLADGSTVADKENYLIEPFVELCEKSGMKGAQVIVAGRSFKGLEGANRNQLKHVWV